MENEGVIMTDILKLAASGEKDKHMAAIEQSKRNLPMFRELIAIAAKEKRIEYQAYIDEGFSPEQALTLCKR